MPNWIENALYVKAKNQQEIFDFIRTKDCPDHDEHGVATGQTFDLLFDFSKVVPIPNLTYATERVEAWGCKWNPTDTHYFVCTSDPHAGQQALAFDTPWSPPYGVLVALSEKFPEAEFTVYSFGVNECFFNRVCLTDGISAYVCRECGTVGQEEQNICGKCLTAYDPSDKEETFELADALYHELIGRLHDLETAEREAHNEQLSPKKEAKLETRS